MRQVIIIINMYKNIDISMADSQYKYLHKQTNPWPWRCSEMFLLQVHLIFSTNNNANHDTI